MSGDKFLTKEEKIWLLAGQLMSAAIFSATHPAVHVYFVSLVSSRTLALADILTTSIAAIVNMSITKESIMIWYRKHFLQLILTDIFLFCLISFESLAIPEVRFVGFAVLNAFSSTLWMMIMRNAIQRVLTGDKLTQWNAFSDSLELWCSLAGGLVAFFWVDMPINVAIGIQCFANIFMGSTDYRFFRMIKPKAYKEGEV